MKRAFTLIELLIVVAIIAILAAIAVPNLMEAQARAKASRALSDMRSLGVAIASYTVDNNVPPIDGYTYLFIMGSWYTSQYPGNQLGNRLSTPVGYITKLPVDPFAKRVAYGGNIGGNWYSYHEFYNYGKNPATGGPYTTADTFEMLTTSINPNRPPYYFAKGPAYGAIGQPTSTWLNNEYYCYAKAKGWLWCLACRGSNGELDNTVYDRVPQMLGDKFSTVIGATFWKDTGTNNKKNLNIYDSTNGTKSLGSIYYTNNGVLTIQQLQKANAN